MKIKNLLLAALFVATAQTICAQTLSFGNYEEIAPEEYDIPENVYDGSNWEVVPFNFYYTNSGSQILYLKDELADLAGKNITAISLKWADTSGSYIVFNPTVKVYIAETNQDAFYKDEESSRYRYFDVSWTTEAFVDQIEFDAMDYAYMVGDEKIIQLSQPFYYSGNNNLVITLMAEDNFECTSGAFYVNFFTTDLEKRALTFCSDQNQLSAVLLDGGEPWAERYNVSVVNMPVHQLSYGEGTPIDETWSSFVPNEDLDLDLVGFSAYKVTDIGETAVSISRVLKAKAGEPLILRRSIIPTLTPTTTAVAQDDNLLQVSDGFVTGDGSTIYALTMRDGKAGMARVASGVTVPAGKVYLVIEEGSANMLSLTDGTNSITELNGNEPATDDAWYTISGQRVSQPTKGLYIHNGKKVTVK